jgi:hypothetical protein
MSHATVPKGARPYLAEIEASGATLVELRWNTHGFATCEVAGGGRFGVAVPCTPGGYEGRNLANFRSTLRRKIAAAKEGRR